MAFAAVHFPSYIRGEADLVLEAGDSPARIRWQEDTAAGAGREEQVALNELTVDLTRATVRPIVPSGLILRVGEARYADREGQLYRNIDPATGAGQLAGSINYSSGEVTLTSWPAGADAVAAEAMLTQNEDWVADVVTFRTPGAPIRPGSLQLRANRPDGSQISATADANGTIAGDGIEGFVDAEVGLVQLAFDPPILPGTLYFNCVMVSYLPLDADQLGLDPVRLPMDGRVPIYRAGDVVVVHHTATLEWPEAAPGATLEVGRTRLAALHLEDAAGERCDPALFTANLDAGTVTLAAEAELSGYELPLRVVHRIEDMAVATDVQITGYISLQKRLSHDYPADALVSSALILGDLQARYSNAFEQRTWNNTWSDEQQGDAPTAQYNDTLYPIEVTNRGAITERWALIFTSNSAFRIVGEFSGEIGTGSINTDTAPNNPATSAPYFTIKAGGWGSGWAAGNVYRFNTIGAVSPIWIARTVLQGEAQEDDDTFRIQIRGNANR